ncbi:ATP-binding protein [Actinomadura soli]|uniref:ATP-binding protein n=1 Tax=Actinomadura soli TaxID=2508997 RepID=A0A5C4J891_9ACTN|nr:ATP-binding protein [Actinomadura soli]TMQ95289.1 ATP-binding protein [Actinomadura soli]
MSDTMRGFRCWSAPSVRETVYSDIGALPSSADAVFLAAHSPMTLDHLKGERQPDAGLDERQVLACLTAGIGDKARNTIIAVTGGSGAGKSHVVRWVHAQLDHADPRYQVLYVPRAVQTIRQLLHKIATGLPGGRSEEFMQQVDAAVGNTSPQQLRDRLLEEMRFTLTWELEPRPARDDETEEQAEAREERTMLLGEDDDQGKRRNGLADLLSQPLINHALLQENGRIHRFVASVYKKTSRRDADQHGFTADELPLKDSTVLKALAANQDLRERWLAVKQDPKPALALLDEALRQAVPKVLGIRNKTSGLTLDELFRSSRTLLRSQGKELVLLFEDLAQFGLIDGELYDQFATAPGPDLTPLRIVFAVTDAPYWSLPETVQTRITHRFAVKTTALADHETFVARYLNLTRVGRADVEDAWAREGSTSSEWIPNACDTRNDGNACQFKDECHSSFGAIDVPELGRVGLYPYNSIALRRSLEACGPEPTPRSIIDSCMSDTLAEADPHIKRGTYPDERVKDRFDFRVQRAKDVVLEGYAERDADRLYRMLVLWGDEEPVDATIFEAFTLDTRTHKTPIKPKPNDKRKDPAPPVEESPLPLVFQWQNGKRLPDDEADTYRNILFHLVSARLNLDEDLIHTATGEGSRILGELFSRPSFDIKGARGRGPGPNRVRFDIERTSDAVKVLAAARWFHDHGHWNPEGGRWPWPQGQRPVDLMITLECQLDAWAEHVRTIFLERVARRDLAGSALGVHAIALLATGAPSASIQHVHQVLAHRPLATPTGSDVPATPAWDAADRQARRILHSGRTAELVGSFAAARQGDTGAPELVDIAALQQGLHQALRAPGAFLRQVSDTFSEVEPTLATSAKDLLETVETAAAEQLREAAAALDVLRTGLEGQEPRTVARAAREAGTRALNSGRLFRPADGWHIFDQALNILEGLPSHVPLHSAPGQPYDPTQAQDQIAEAVMIQSWARWAVAGADALATIQRAMASTRDEAQRSSSLSSNHDQLQQDVRQKLAQARQHLEALKTMGGPTDE